MGKKRMILVISGLTIAIAALTAFFLFGNRTSAVVGGASLPSLLSNAKANELKQNLQEARNAYQKLVNEFPNSKEVMSWQKKIDEINIKLLFSPAVTAKSLAYEIKPGDTLTKIAKQFKTTIELLMKSNNLPDGKIIPGRKIKVWTAPFSVLVDKSQNVLILKSADDVIKTYIVSTGKNNSTPVGTFKITTKLVNPTWFKSGAVIAPGSADNALGSRWMGFDLTGYGIHGTIDPQSLGSQVTEGCVRLSNADVEELYIVVPVGTEVVVVD